MTAARAPVALLLAAVAVLAGCGTAGPPLDPDTGEVPGCPPVAGQQLVLLVDDRHLESAENIVPAVSAQAATPPVLAALDRVSSLIGQDQLLRLNKATNVDERSPAVAAAEFATATKLTDGIPVGPGGTIVIGTGSTNENQNIGQLYKIALTAAGYQVSVRQVGDRSAYVPDLQRNRLQVVPEAASTLAEYLNGKINGAAARPVASGDLAQAMVSLRALGQRAGLRFGAPAAAADQNAFAVTRATAQRYRVATLSDFAARCSGLRTVMGGPAACPREQFCLPGLARTYGLAIGRFTALDAGGPQTLAALHAGTVSIALMFSSDTALVPR